ncbi:hypothetical protein OG765_33910 [Streptomyces sp. NBC_00555]|uniref:hypothetical protein n=1 Tax=Streptomyces sp. NBC_00555 TaxID=2903662 RepID=UPI00225354A5|nr:hypothetical protein [Streptomyces sp. NBC_00555]MCX5015919.1 hypothetical protein [Streptomyces sp. NBC_00555]
MTRSAELRFREVFFSNPFGALRAGEVDAVTTWLPVREPDLTVGVVLRDAPPVRWALIWRTDRATPLVRALAEAVTDCADATGR